MNWVFWIIIALFSVAVLLNLLELKNIRRFMGATNQGLTDLQASVAAETAQSAVVVTALQTLSGQITDLQSQVASLQAQLAAGTEVTDAQLETFAQTLNSAQSTVAAALPTPPAPTT